MTFAAEERRQLADLLLAQGPDAPTLCEGWCTRELAAHLYVREHRPLAAMGMFVKPLASRLEHEMELAAARDYSEVVREWANGPSKFHPFYIADAKANLAEHFVHHEDVRRGDGTIEPRSFDPSVEEAILRYIKRAAPLLIRGNDKPLVLTPVGYPPITLDARRRVAKQGSDVVRVKGEPGELLLFLFGRDAVQVSIDGDADSLNRGV